MSAARKGHLPLRRCVVCRRSRPQAELIRLTPDDDGNWRLDLERRAGGRGSWLCRDADCHDERRLKRFFRARAPQVAALLDRHTAFTTSQDGGIDV